MYFTVNGEICPDARNLYQPRDEQIFALDYWERCNGIWNYRNRPGEAHLLVTADVRDDIAGFTGPVTITIVDENTGTTTLLGWTVVKCENTEASYDGNEIYYCMLKDRRWIANQVRVSDSYSLLEDAHDYGITGTMTWQEVLNQLWTLMPSNAVGASATCPTLATTPSSYAENIDLDGVPLWDAIRMVCNACGHVACYNAGTDTYTFQTAYGTQSGLAAILASNASNLIWDSNCPSIGAGNLPATIAVSFKPRLQTIINPSKYGKPTVKTAASGFAGAVSGSVLTLHDTTLTMTNGDNILNGTQLDNRLIDLTRTAKSAAHAANNRSSYAYNALIGFSVGSQLTQVAWANHPRKGVYTQIEYYEEMDIQLPRPSERNASVVEVVRVTNYTPDGNGLYDAVVERYIPSSNTWETLYDAKVLDLNG